MRYVRLGRTEARVSAVGFGTWPLGGPIEVDGAPEGWSGHDDERARRALVRAAELGVTHWDTADAYGEGRAERLIGSCWRDVRRDEIFLASKVGWVRGPFERFYHPAQMRRQLERSLRNLATDVIDLHYLHHCGFGPRDECLDDAVAAMQDFRAEGKIRFVGLSDWRGERIARYLPRVDPDVVQTYRNVLDDDYERSGLRTAVEARDLGVVFFSPLKHGLLLGKYEAPPAFGAGDVRSAQPEFADAELVAALWRNAEALRRRFAAHEQPVLHALVGALLADEPNASVLLGQRSPEQAEAAAAAGEPLSREDAEWVRDLYARLRATAPVTA